jgi:hypothetical protein
MLSTMEPFRKRPKTGGRIKGTPNRVTADIRQALKDLADDNAGRVQEWLDRVAQSDPAEAMRLWLALLRFVTPTLQAAAIEEISRHKSKREILCAMTDEELMAAIRAEEQPPAALIEYSPESDPLLA